MLDRVKLWIVVKIRCDKERRNCCIRAESNLEEKGLDCEVWLMSHGWFWLKPFNQIKWGQVWAGRNWIWDCSSCTGWVKCKGRWWEEFRILVLRVEKEWYNRTTVALGHITLESRVFHFSEYTLVGTRITLHGGKNTVMEGNVSWGKYLYAYA